MGLTGKFKFRKKLWGKIVLRVEEEVKPFWSKQGAVKRRWRDATLMDLTAIEMRFLIDKGLMPWLRSQSQPAPGKTSDPPPSEIAVLAETSGPIQQASGLAH